MKLVRLKLVSKFREYDLDLNIDQFTMLFFISEKDASTQQDIANHFMRDKSIVLRQVNTLIDMHYVVRVTDKEDKRKKNLILTEKGSELLQLLKRLSHEVSAELLNGISEEEQGTFESVISKIQANTGFKDCLLCC